MQIVRNARGVSFISRSVNFYKFIPVLCPFLVLGCQDPNEIALKIGAPSQSAAKIRAFEIRQFDDIPSIDLLTAGASTLQDLGFTITESAPDVGVLVAEKQRDAKEAGQIAGQVALTIGLALLGGLYSPVWDETQSIHVTLVISPGAGGQDQQIRVSFDRYVTNNRGQQWRTELIDDPKIYQAFYDKILQAVHLSAKITRTPES